MTICKKCWGSGRGKTVRPKVFSPFDPRLKQWEEENLNRVLNGGVDEVLPKHLMFDEVDIDCRHCSGLGYIPTPPESTPCSAS